MRSTLQRWRLVRKNKTKACKKQRRKRRAGKEAVFVSTFYMSRMGRMGIINVVIIWGRVLIKLDAREVICNDEDKDEISALV